LAETGKLIYSLTLEIVFHPPNPCVETHYLKGMMGNTILTGEFKFLKIDLSESFRNRKTWEKKFSSLG
jgi:hypothetical protein